MTFLFAVLRWARRFAVLIAVVAMLALNALTLTVPAVASVATGLVASAGLTPAVRTAANARAARQAATRIGRRVARGAARNLGALGAESLPWVGAGVAVAVTALELKDACDTMKDLKEIEAAQGGPAEDADLREVCGMDVPSLPDLRADLAARGDLILEGARRRFGIDAPPAPAD